MCILCFNGRESILHAFFGSAKAPRIFGKKLEFFEDLDKRQLVDFIELIYCIWEQGSKTQMEKFACLSWENWNRMNQLFHTNQHKDDGSLIQTCLQLLSDFQDTIPRKSDTLRHLICWRPPPQGSYYINVDEAVSSKIGVSVVGMVIRNSSGHLCVARAL